MHGDAGELVMIGTGVRAHGVRGEVRVAPLSGDPQRFGAGLSVVWRRDGFADRSLTVRRARGKGELAYVFFDEIADRTAAEPLNGGQLWARADSSPDLGEDGGWYHHQLLGLEVVDEAGSPLGRLTGIFDGPAHDNLEVTSPGGVTWLVPAVPAFLLRVELEAGRVVLRPIPGLIPEAARPDAPGPPSDGG
ncbi:MAG: ribosome maturation factor RimM [Nitrospirota bacterium]|nr:ribosome maturation factor RimM [Nitrospirota bacterium]